MDHECRLPLVEMNHTLAGIDVIARPGHDVQGDDAAVRQFLTTLLANPRPGRRLVKPPQGARGHPSRQPKDQDGGDSRAASASGEPALRLWDQLAHRRQFAPDLVHAVQCSLMNRIRPPVVKNLPLVQRHRPSPLSGEPSGRLLLNVIVWNHGPKR
ncbi:hypothetical protein D3C72_1623560 [compost metagenome]